MKILRKASILLCLLSISIPASGFSWQDFFWQKKESQTSGPQNLSRDGNGDAHNNNGNGNGDDHNNNGNGNGDDHNNNGNGNGNGHGNGNHNNCHQCPHYCCVPNYQPCCNGHYNQHNNFHSHENCCDFDDYDYQKLLKKLRHAIKTKTLCAKNVKALCANIKNLRAHKIHAKKGSFKKITAQHVCIARKLKAKELCAEELNVNRICSSGESKMQQLEVCQQFKATTVFNCDTNYTLGTNLNFDVALEDPNGSISFGPTQYTVPVSGTYIITLQVDQNNLQGANPILGSPVGNLEILVNGTIFRQTYTPFLTFSDNQFSTTSTLIKLKAGDTVSSRYNVLVLTETGISEYTGTVNLLGNGSDEDKSVFKIHYLSSDCCEPICEPCCVECKDEKHHKDDCDDICDEHYGHNGHHNKP